MSVTDPESTLNPSVTPEQPADSSPSAPAVPSYDPSYVSRLEAEYQQAQSILQGIQPYVDDIKWMAQNEDNVEFIRKARKNYDIARQPEIDPTYEPVLRQFREELAPVKQYVEEIRSERTRSQQAEHQKFLSENTMYANRLQAQEKLSRDDLVEVAAYADALANRYQRNVGIEEAWKKLTSRGSQKEAAPPSLRADAGAVGIPGNSTSKGNDRWKSDFHGALTDSIRAAQKAG